jgi:hypothetical protein
LARPINRNPLDWFYLSAAFRLPSLRQARGGHQAGFSLGQAGAQQVTDLMTDEIFDAAVLLAVVVGS